MTTSTETGVSALRTIGGASAWKAAELAESAWQLQLDSTVIAALHRAASSIAARGGFGAVASGDLAIPQLQGLVRTIWQRLHEGCGFVLLRGLPVNGPDTEVEALFWALGCQLGSPLPQNHQGHMLDRVRDEGIATVRGAKTNRALVYHTDFAGVIPEVFGLLTIRPARAGGESLVVSGHAAHDELLRRSPEALLRLYDDFWFDRSGDVGPGIPPLLRSPVFSRTERRVAVVYNRARIHRGHRQAKAPLQRQDLDALDRLDAVLASDELNLRFTLAAGDALLVHNAVVLHNRTAFEDDEAPQRKRLLLRIWLRTHG